MPEWRTRTLSYRRAAWLVEGAGRETLEQLLRRALAALPNVDDTVIDRGEGTAEDIRHRLVGRRALHIHLTAYTRGEEASVVSDPPEAPESDVDTVGAPPGSHFMDADSMLRISGNDVVLCTSNMRDTTCTSYLSALFHKAGLGKLASSFDLVPVANANKIRIIEQYGVKRITFNLSLYGEAIQQMQDGRPHGIVRKARELMRTALELDPTPEQIEAAENVQARVSFSFDSRKGGAVQAARLLGQGAENVVRHYGDDYVIETRNDQVIKSDEVLFRKPVQIRSYGKSIRHNDAWHALDQYYSELVESGATEW